ncbi:unnamed protein product [Thelazia callipaeda]|uniref:Uncharacterized protein n=1 Tax=Thelazia callipaeda TaxID=103827 RepID=A0A0N5CZJ5_THECL|nr:unnamed protein product [Thelazia callipaeda]
MVTFFKLDSNKITAIISLDDKEYFVRKPTFTTRPTQPPPPPPSALFSPRSKLRQEVLPITNNLDNLSSSTRVPPIPIKPPNLSTKMLMIAEDDTYEVPNTTRKRYAIFLIIIIDY